MTSYGMVDEIFAKVRTRILNFVPRGWSGSISTLLTGDMLYVQVPDDSIYPYAVAKFQGVQRQGAYNGMRLNGSLEIQVYGRPREMAQLVEQIADGIQEAMLLWSDVSSGLVFSREDQRDTLPQYADPADREVAGVRLLFDFVAWPRFLSQYSVS